MLVNGLSPGVPVNEQKLSNLEEEKATEQAAADKEAMIKAAVQEEANKEAQKEKVDTSKFVMNDLHLKELLFMVSSRGNTSTVEKLAQLLKKEREMLTRK